MSDGIFTEKEKSMKTKKFRQIIAATTMFAGCVLSAPNAHAGADWLRGNISDMTTTAAGLFIKLDTGMPTNCIGVSTYGWMLIPEANRTMGSFAMGKWFTQQRGVDVYVVVQGGMCVVTQVDSN